MTVGDSGQWSFWLSAVLPPWKLTSWAWALSRTSGPTELVKRSHCFYHVPADLSCFFLGKGQTAWAPGTHGDTGVPAGRQAESSLCYHGNERLENGQAIGQRLVRKLCPWVRGSSSDPTGHAWGSVTSAAALDGKPPRGRSVEQIHSDGLVIGGNKATK